MYYQKRWTIMWTIESIGSVFYYMSVASGTLWYVPNIFAIKEKICLTTSGQTTLQADIFIIFFTLTLHP